MEVPEESFHWSSWDSRTCYPRRAFIQGLTDDRKNARRRPNNRRIIPKTAPDLIPKEERTIRDLFLIWDMVWISLWIGAQEVKER